MLIDIKASSIAHMIRRADASSKESRLRGQKEIAYSYAAKLYRLTYARVGNREDTEDIVQEAYFKAFKSMSKFKWGSDMESWLITILLNTIRDHIRKVSKSGNLVSIDDLVSETELLPTELIDRRAADSMLEENELSDELTTALQKLPEFFLMPLLLRDVQDLSYKEIARCLDIPIGTVMSRLGRARDILRQHLRGTVRADKWQQGEQVEK